MGDLVVITAVLLTARLSLPSVRPLVIRSVAFCVALDAGGVGAGCAVAPLTSVKTASPAPMAMMSILARREFRFAFRFMFICMTVTSYASLKRRPRSRLKRYPSVDRIKLVLIASDFAVAE